MERGQVEALRTSRRRLLIAADGERRNIERDLHDGVQQQLVALAVNLQLARDLTGSDPAAARKLLVEMGRDVQQALDETAQLAQRIYPQVDAVGLGAALRSAALSAGVRASVDTNVMRSPPELLIAAYWCWLEVLNQAGPNTRASITVREQDGALAFDIVASNKDAVPSLEHAADRIEALDGTLATQSVAAGTRISGSLPLPE